MIRYALKCANDHGFESWFQSATAFDTLQSSGMVTCPECGVAEVAKAIMAPRVRPARSKAVAPLPIPPAPKGKGDVPKPLADASNSQPDMPGTDIAARPDRPLQTPQTEAETKLAELRKHVEANSDYVGLSFAAEARKMNEGEAPMRSIYGEANLEEAKKLIEEGVPVAPLPFIPVRKTN